MIDSPTLHTSSYASVGNVGLIRLPGLIFQQVPEYVKKSLTADLLAYSNKVDTMDLYSLTQTLNSETVLRERHLFRKPSVGKSNNHCQKFSFFSKYAPILGVGSYHCRIETERPCTKKQYVLFKAIRPICSFS